MAPSNGNLRELFDSTLSVANRFAGNSSYATYLEALNTLGAWLTASHTWSGQDERVVDAANLIEASPRAFRDVAAPFFENVHVQGGIKACQARCLDLVPKNSIFAVAGSLTSPLARNMPRQLTIPGGGLLELPEQGFQATLQVVWLDEVSLVVAIQDSIYHTIREVDGEFDGEVRIETLEEVEEPLPLALAV